MGLYARLRKKMPTREQIQANRWLAWLAPWLGHPRLWHWSRRGVAMGVTLGVFFGLLIPIAQIPLSVGAAVLLRASVGDRPAIVDPMCGSGTTLDVCRDLGREGHGFDLQPYRPDIQLAEQNLIAANALIGAAKAAYFPTISLTGLFGYASNGLSDLFDSQSKAWQYAAPITMPIFTAGAIAGQVQEAEAAQQQALFAYQRTIQEAFREVNDALISQERTREQLRAQKQQVKALEQYSATARLRYDNGYTSYIEVLDAERSLFNVQLQYTQTQQTQFQAMISLYLAMGGGWISEADKLTTAADHMKPVPATESPSTGTR